MKPHFPGAALAVLLVLASVPALAGIVVITHPSVNVAALTPEQVGQIYLGRVGELPDGSAVVPLDLAEGAPLRAQFNDRVLHKNEQQLRNYWSRMIFTGKGQPPRVLPNTAEVLRTVASSPGYVGYVDSKDVVAGKVKILFTAD